MSGIVELLSSAVFLYEAAEAEVSRAIFKAVGCHNLAESCHHSSLAYRYMAAGVAIPGEIPEDLAGKFLEESMAAGQAFGEAVGGAIRSLGVVLPRSWVDRLEQTADVLQFPLQKEKAA